MAALAAVAALSLAGCTGRGSATVASAAGASTLSAPSSSAGGRWKTYRNSRYGFSVQVPANLSAPPPLVDRGQTFRSADGHTAVTASASASDAGKAPATVAATYATDLRRRGDLTSSVSDATTSEFTVTGHLYGGRYVEYVHGVVGTRAAYTVTWTYPTSEQKVAAPWVRHSVQTLRPGP